MRGVNMRSKEKEKPTGVIHSEGSNRAEFTKS